MKVSSKLSIQIIKVSVIPILILASLVFLYVIYSSKLPSGEKVTVLKVGARRSQFLAEDKTVIIVPNTDLSKSKIVNFTYGERIGA